MTQPDHIVANPHDASAEVELSAQELLALSLASAGAQQARTSRVRTASSRISRARAASSADAHGRRSLDVRKALFRVGQPLGLAVGVIAIAGALHAYVSTGVSAQSAKPALIQAAAQPTSPLPEPGGIPVRFANPFDPSEVFEFPAGTTEAEAREAVADFLIERAANRQARLDPKPSRLR